MTISTKTQTTLITLINGVAMFFLTSKHLAVLCELENLVGDYKTKVVRKLTDRDTWTNLAFSINWAKLTRRCVIDAIALVIAITWLCWLSACQAIECLAETTSPVYIPQFEEGDSYEINVDDLTHDVWEASEVVPVSRTFSSYTPAPAPIYLLAPAAETAKPKAKAKTKSKSKGKTAAKKPQPKTSSRSTKQ